jgi:hypothetical protein
MPVFNNILAGSSGQSTGYDIEQSLRFDDGDNAYLSRTPGSAGNLKTWTLSFWRKQESGSTTEPIMACGSYSGGLTSVYFNGSGRLSVIDYSSSAFNVKIYAEPSYRDPSAWAHYMVVWDTSNAASTDRVRIFKDGSRVTDINSGGNTFPSLNFDGEINSAALHMIGRDGSASSDYGRGYIAEVHFLDGTALTDASSFGETDAATNQWKPIEYTGSYGTNGFYQKYSSTELANSFTDSSEGGFIPSETLTCNVLIVGGGGGGGEDVGGGGGAGGFRYLTSQSVGAAAHTVVVGAGGAAGSGPTGSAGSGANSSFAISDGSTLSATGGGGGSNYNFGTPATGGSGGGTKGYSTGTGFVGAAGNAGGYTPVEGYKGGDKVGNTTSTTGAGGGGSSAVGSNSTENRTGYAAGGAGTSNLITGSAVTYAAGGNGGGDNWTGGATSTPNTGDGGDGAGLGASQKDGASGVVIISYISTTEKATGGTITSYVDGGDTYQVHTFTSSAPNPRHTITANGDVANTRAQYKIGDSSIKFDGTGDYLSMPDSSDWQLGGGTGNFTIECWVYVNTLAGSKFIYAQYADTSNRVQLYQSDTTGRINFDVKSGGVTLAGLYTTVGITAETWHHIAIVRETVSITIYIDGVAVAQTEDTAIGTNSIPNLAALAMIGDRGTGLDWDGYMDEIRISDSARYTTTFTPSTTAFTADANTKLLIHSDFNGGLGADSSGNKNDFAVTNLVATDQMIDTPTNNYCTLNPLDQWQSPAFSEGNLKTSSVTGGEYEQTSGTVGVNSGKWYFEARLVDTSAGGHQSMGVKLGSAPINSWAGGDAGHWMYYSEGKIVHGGTTTDTTPVSYGTAIIGCAIDMDNGEIYWAKDNTWITNSSGVCDPVTRANPCYSDLSGSVLPFISVYESSTNWTLNAGQDSSFAGAVTAQGNGGDGEDFYYTPPTGYKALNTDNLPDPAIALPTAHFDTQLWTGTGSGQTFSNFSFQPDFLWFKQRNGTSDHALFDSVRGVNSGLSSNTSGAENTVASASQDLVSFDDDGFTTGIPSQYGSLGSSTNTIATWAWKAGGTASTIAAGSIDGTNPTIASSVSANTTAGFSISTYDGNATGGATIAHGLSVAPEMVILKQLDTASTHWYTGYTIPNGIGWDAPVILNLTGAGYNDAGYFWDTAPSASVVTLGQYTDVNGTGMLAYCFHSISGYSKIGVYEGNGSVDGSYINLGFKPEFFLIKNIDAVEGWEMWDGTRETYNKLSKKISPNTSDAEYTANTTTYAIDFLSNGVKLRTSYSAVNAANTFLYYAVASSPFKTSNAR